MANGQFPSPFTMHGCREVWEHMGSPDTIGRMIDLCERSVLDAPAFVFDTSKSLVESVCKTVMAERAVTADTRWDLPKLLKETLKCLGLVPDGYTGDGEELMRRMAGGLQTTVQALGELRTKEGLLGHGKDAFAKQLAIPHALFAARSADAVIHFLYMAHIGNFEGRTEERLELEDNPEFNQYVDDLHEVVVFEAPYQASEVLFRVDLDAYRNYLATFDPDQIEAGS